MGFKVFTKLCPVATFNIVKVVTVLGQVFWVSGVEGETIAASLKFSDAIVTLPVFVAWNMMGVETEVIWAFEWFLGDRCK